jgi:hypothetical protein
MALCTAYSDPTVARLTTHTAATRPTGSALHEGKVIYETDTKRTLVYDGTNWVILDEPLQTYSPSLTGVTIGNGTVTAKRHRADGWDDVTVKIVLGSTSAITGLIQVSLPTLTDATFTGGGFFFAVFEDVGVASYWGMGLVAGSPFNNILQLYSGNAAAAAMMPLIATSATVPFTWGTGDTIWMSARYPMASRYS